MNNENKINATIDLMKLKDASYMSVKMPDGVVRNCVVIPVTEPDGHGGTCSSRSGLRLPSKYKTADGREHISVQLRVLLDRYGEKFYASEKVTERYRGKALPSHSVRVVLARNLRDRRISAAMDYYAKSDVKPEWWNYKPDDDERRKQVGYQLDASLQIGQAYFEQLQTVQPQQTAEASAVSLDSIPSAQDEAPFPPSTDAQGNVVMSASGKPIQMPAAPDLFGGQGETVDDLPF